MACREPPTRTSWQETGDETSIHSSRRPRWPGTLPARSSLVNDDSPQPRGPRPPRGIVCADNRFCVLYPCICWREGPTRATSAVRRRASSANGRGGRCTRAPKSTYACASASMRASAGSGPSGAKGPGNTRGEHQSSWRRRALEQPLGRPGRLQRAAGPMRSVRHLARHLARGAATPGPSRSPWRRIPSVRRRAAASMSARSPWHA